MTQQVYLTAPQRGYVLGKDEEQIPVHPGPGIFPLVDNISDNYGHMLVVNRSDGADIYLPEPDMYDVFIFDDEQTTAEEARKQHEHWALHEREMERQMELETQFSNRI